MPKRVTGDEVLRPMATALSLSVRFRRAFVVVWLQGTGPMSETHKIAAILVADVFSYSGLASVYGSYAGSQLCVIVGFADLDLGIDMRAIVRNEGDPHSPTCMREK